MSKRHMARVTMTMILSILEILTMEGWLTRVHMSNIGIGRVIDLLTGFVIDFEVMSKLCEECQQTKLIHIEDTAEFYFWYEGYRDFCSITNHQSPSSIMSGHLARWK
ncbi:hypothetical protein AVEN_47542-1 [Araneus ventricosus]|uniref:Secreted protein n=1 Tax=Araneus ventricosus TaxID=182803 RepID=A0A4Y2GNN6_ARAVE|nr:hypothetical protein AVEN_47542-1 [Araneus ventricosus]